ncbi:hypothetical protein E0K83_12700 [Gramella sp. BOM4]|nr:hypothetical protein [Christiangramia bathymodioli]
MIFTPSIIKRSVLLLLFINSFTTGFSQNTITIPDQNFEQALIDLGIDSDLTINNSVQSSDVEFIETLDVSGRGITSLTGIEGFFNLKFLYAYNNELTGIDVSNNPRLVHLSLNDNSLGNLNVTGNSLLEELHVNNNQLIELSLGDKTELRTLHAGGNQINSIDLSLAPKLVSLILWGSELTSIDLSSSPELSELVLDDNNLSSLDVSSNPNLQFLYASNNQLVELNIANGNNVNFTPPSWNDYSLVVQGNGGLTCIQVDSEIMGSIPSDWAKDFGVIYSSDCFNKPEYVNIPDPNFEQALIDLGIDSDGALNAFLLLSDAEQVTTLDLNNAVNNESSSIRDLSGIEAFVNLEGLLVNYNGLEQLDVSSLNALRFLYASGNNLSQLDLSQNPDLEFLRLNGNSLDQLDLSNNPNLAVLRIADNNITELDLSANSQLKDLQLVNNPISNINTQNLTELEKLSCGKTNLTSIDLSNNLKLKELSIDELPIDEINLRIFPDLERFWARNTPLGSIDFSQNPNLLQVWIEYSPLKALDLSNNPALFAVVLQNISELAHLDLRNGNNSAVTFFMLNNTPNLTCINADANPSQAMLSSGKTFSEDCGDFIFIADSNFEQALIDIGIDSDGMVNQSIMRSDAEAVTNLNLTVPAFVPENEQGYANSEIVNVESKIQDLIGIEAFINLTNLRAFSHELTSIDVSELTELIRLELVNNQITSIDVSQNTKLEVFWLETNHLSEVDLTNNANLRNIALGYNNLTEIDVTQNPDLWALTIEGNDLTSVDVSKNTEIAQIWLAENPNLTKVDFSKNTKMYGLGIYNTAIKSLDLSNNPMTRLFIGNNPNLEHVDLRNGNNSNLNQFWADNTPNLTCINADASISQAMIDSGKSFREDCGDFIYVPDPNFEQALIDLEIDSDGVVNTSVLREDVETIENLDVSKRGITSLVGLEAFVNLKDLYAFDNQIENIDVRSLPELKHLSLDRNSISQLDVSNNPLLQELYVSENDLSQLDLGDQPDLRNLHAGGGNLTQIDLSKAPNLQSLILWGSELTEIDLNSNLELVELVLDDNNLTSLDISKNPKVQFVYAVNNALTSLNIANGNNANFTTPDWNEYSLVASGNPNLTCIQVDAEMVFNVPSEWAKDAHAIYTSDCTTKPEYVNIPDSNFEQSLIDMGMDSDAVINTWMLKSDAEAVTDLNLNNPNFDNSAFANQDLINVSGKIADLTGIEAFVNLKNLQAAYGALTSVDLSANTQLEELFLNDNQLNSVDISMLPNLKRFGIMRNNLTSGVDVSGNPLLEELFVHYTGISSIDLSANPNLWNLFIQNNELTSLDLSANANLIRLSAQNNQISELDISMLSVIERIDAQYNPNMNLITGATGNPTLTSLNLSGTGLSNFNGAVYPNLEWLLLNDNSLGNFNGNNTLNLQNLFLNNNSITKLNLTGNSQLSQLQVMNNGMEELDLRNGNNTILGRMNATGNSFTCISVDAPTDSTMPYSQWEVDLGVIFSDNCKQAEEVVIIPDPNFEQALIDLGFDTNGISGNILLSDAEAITSLDVPGRSIADATGIEGFVNLVSLNMSNNLLTEIDLIENGNLFEIDLSGNTLSELVISNGKILLSLNVSDNDLDVINFADITDLEFLDISGNSFESLDFREFGSLEYLNVSNNMLSRLDLRNGNNQAITYMDASGNLLNCIGVDDASNIPAGWTKDTEAAYTETGDCESPIVLTRDISISLDRYGLAEITPQDVDNGSYDEVTEQKNLVYSLDTYQFGCEDLGHNEVILEVTDASGNVGAAIANVKVIDELAPDVSAVRSVSLDLSGAASIALDAQTLDDGSSDNCVGLEFSVNQSSFSFPGTYTVQLTATDASGNTASTSVDVEVVDSASQPTSLKFKKNLVATVYPNPFSDQIRIGFSKTIDLNSVEVSLFTMTGTNSGIQFSVQDNEIVSSNADGLPVTTYSLIITVNGESQSAIVIKE